MPMTDTESGKPLSRRKNPNTGIIGSFMPSALYRTLEAKVPRDMQKHIFFDSVFRAYVKAWNKGSVLRAYIGAPARISEQRSFYIDKRTIAAARQIAKLDGVSVSQVLRTAIAWYLHHEKSRSDKLGTDRILGKRRQVKL